MTPTVPSGLHAVVERVEAIHSRVAAHPAFAAVLQSAQPSEPAGEGRAGRAPVEGLTTGPATSATGSALGADASRRGSEATGAGGDPPAWASRLPDGGRRWAAQVDEAARRHGVDPPLFAALVWAESGFSADAVSHAGAVGLAQLMPATAAGLGVDPHDPEQNLDGGARYLADQLDRFGDERLALAAYNAGPGRVARAGGVPQIAETQQYVTRVADYAGRLRGGTT